MKRVVSAFFDEDRPINVLEDGSWWIWEPRDQEWKRYIPPMFKRVEPQPTKMGPTVGGT